MRVFLVVLSVLTALFCMSCGESRSTYKIYSEIALDAGRLPEGEIYTPSDTPLPNKMRNAMYGEDSEKKFALLEDYTVYISSFEAPYEIAVFKCRSHSDGLIIEEMCRERRDLLSVALRETKFHDRYKDIKISRNGEYVIFTMLDADEK